MSFTRFNKEIKKWKYDTSKLPTTTNDKGETIKVYKKLKELVAEGVKELNVYGFYINEDEDFGKSVSVITDVCMVNLPSHAVAVFESMTDEDKATIDNGGLKLTNFREFTFTKGKFKGRKTIYFDYADNDVEVPFN